MIKWVVVATVMLVIAYFGLSAIKQLQEISKYRIDYYNELLQLDERY
jgi:hypothetical protein